MVELDGDDIRISSRGKLAERDIVQVRLSCRKLFVLLFTSREMIFVCGYFMTRHASLACIPPNVILKGKTDIQVTV